MKRFTAFALIFCLLLGLAACAGKTDAVNEQQPKPTAAQTGGAAVVQTGDKPAANDVQTGETPVPTGIHAAKDASEVFKALSDFGGYRSYDMGMVYEAADAEAEEAPAPMPMPEPMAQNDGAKNADYSETNVQVAGVDEGDIVKTDGKYIYVLRDLDLLILEANSADSRVLFQKTVGKNGYDTKNDKDGNYIGDSGLDFRPTELYVSDGRLAVVYYDSAWSDFYEEATGRWNYEDTTTATVEFYDVRDPSAPVRTAVFSQDGSYRTSRLTDGKLYLLSDYWVYDAQEGEPETFMPHVYREGEPEVIDASCIWIPERGQSSRYTIVTALDFTDGGTLGTLSLLGGCGTVYMNGENLYLADSVNYEVKSEPRTEEIYTVVDCRWVQETRLTRISLAGGALTVAASGRVAGNLLNQFSLDEHKGFLRVVTTVSGSRYTVYTDEKRGFVNYEWPDEQEQQTNGLYVLDGALSVVGSLTGLAESERVYSVRFDGDIGYFVTFRQTDPLFAVDLSEPAAPTLLSALKIPGFSEYLHVYGEGRLFGLGMAADEETGWTETMKLSMFDVSDPADVTEKHTLVLDEYWSEALYNHKAILISPAKDVIAFPADGGYVIYGYNDADGFYLRSRIGFEGETWWYGNARGVYIGEYAYVVLADTLWVLDLDTLSSVGTVKF